MRKEIEKKYLLKSMPIGVSEGVEIHQGYLSTSDPEVRIRSKGSKYFVTRKGGEGFVREEAEEEVTKETFEIIWPATVNARIEKTRFQITGSDGLIWEIDEYHGRLTGLFTAEVELPNCETKAEIPAEIAKVLAADVTEDKRYKNKALAVNSLV